MVPRPSLLYKDVESGTSQFIYFHVSDATSTVNIDRGSTTICIDGACCENAKPSARMRLASSSLPALS